MKTNASGVVQWSKTYGGPSLYGDYGFSIQQTNDSGYIITGETFSFGVGFKNIYLIKTDSNGNSGCSNQGTAATFTSNIVMQNLTPTSTTFSGGTALNPPTISHNGGTQTSICTVLSTSEEIDNQGSILVYPNPFSDIVTIEIPNFSSTVEATILDVTGKTLAKFELNSQSNTFGLSTLNRGIYFCQLKSTTHTQTIKLVKN